MKIIFWLLIIMLIAFLSLNIMSKSKINIDNRHDIYLGNGYKF
jgi:hypothetical protein